jgi:hypothetical protein
MKFMLMMHAPRGDGDWGVSDWEPEDLRAHIRYMHRFNQELEAAGEFVGGEGLAQPGEAKIVRGDKAGAPEVTDGPFPEAKEFLAGFWIIECESKERAYALAARASMAPGPGGEALHIPIEVREVLAAPPSDL